MLRMDAVDANRWCTSRGFPLSGGEHGGAAAQLVAAKSFSLKLPEEGLRLVDVANWTLVLDDATSAAPFESVLVWLLDWDIWSVERERVGMQLMHALLGASDIKERPAVEFSVAEMSAAQSLISLVALFQWDAIVVPSHGEYLFRFSHHGVADIHTRAADVEAAIVDGIRSFEVQ